MQHRQVFSGLLLSISFSALGLGLLLFLHPAGDLILSFEHLQFTFLGLALGVLVLAWTADALRVSSLAAAAGSSLPFWDAFRAVLAGGFMINVTPFYAGAGLVHTYVLSRRGLNVPRAAATVIGGSFLSQLVQGLWLLLVFVAFTPDNRRLLAPPVKAALVSYLGVLVFLVVLLSVVMSFRQPPAVVGRVASGAIFKRLAGPAGELIAGLRTLAGSGPAGLLPVIAYTALYYVTFYSVSWFLLAAVGVYLPVPELITIQVLIFMVFAIMPTPGGSGGIELGAAYLFSKLLEPVARTVFILLWRFLTFYLSLAVGGFVLFTFLPEWLHSVRKLTDRRRR